MPTQLFNGTLSGDGSYMGERFIGGDYIQSNWNIFNVNSDNRSVWGIDAQNWLQYRSAFTTYAGRYNEIDFDLGDTFFEVDIQPLGTGRFEVGFFFRFTDRLKTYYYLTYQGGYANWGGKNIRLYKVSGGSSFMVADYAVTTWTASTIYKFKCEMLGNNFKIYLNDMTTPIIDYTDVAANVAMKGAFGPWVLGQEFAKWRGFNTVSLTAFTVSQNFTGQSIATDFNTPDTAKLFDPNVVSQILDDEFRAIIQGKYASHSWKAFRLSTTNPKVHMVFGRTTNTATTDPNSQIYVYQDFVAAPPMPASNPVLTAVDSRTIKLTWDHPVQDDMEDGFYIMDQDDNIVATVGPDTKSVIEANLVENTTYYRKVVAYNQYGLAPATQLVSITTPRTLPAAPTNFKGMPSSDVEILWTWSDNSLNEDSFELVGWDDQNKLVVIAVLPPDTTQYAETGLTPSTAYTRAIRAVNTVGPSPLSNTYQVTTKQEQLDPPGEAPINFYGVGVSESSIYWYWQDITNNEDGFELLDKNDNVIATIPANTRIYLEENLEASQFYHRKIRAYNSWGLGPATGLATAKTLPSSLGYTDRPAPCYNMGAEVLSTTSARVYWDYIEDPNYPADGFKIYNEEGLMMAAVTAAEMEFTFIALQPDTTYKFHVVAFNANGNGRGSNTVIFVTPHIVPPIPEPEQPKPEEEVITDIFYDEETEETGKIEAFQSGVGDHLDLKVSNLYPVMPNLERFEYTLFIKGYYDDKLASYHPAVSFRFRVITTGRQKYRVRQSDGTYVDMWSDYYDATDWITASVNGDSTDSGLKPLTYPVSKGIPFNTEDVVYQVEVQLPDGTPIPVQDQTTSVQWFLNFSNTNTTTDHGDYINFSSSISNVKDIQRSWEAPISRGGPFEVLEGSETHFTKYIRAAQLNYGWRPDIYGYKLVITSSNPNVELLLERDIQNFTPDDSTLIEVKLKARIINETQTLWYPSIHSGYYYLNQQEHHLFIDDKVRPKDGDIDSTFILQFPYEIRAYGKRFYKDRDVEFIDTNKADFLQGKINPGLTFDKYAGSITLADNFTKAGFVSRPFWFGNPITQWNQIYWSQDEKAIQDGAKLKVEMVRCDEAGDYDESDWIEQTNGQLVNYPITSMEPVERVRYRLTLESGEKKRDYTLNAAQSYEMLKQGYHEKTIAEGTAVKIDTVASNAEGLFILRPIYVGANINSLGTIDIDINTPNGSSVSLYSVVGKAESDPAFYDRTKWTPLQLVSGKTYRINSAYQNPDGTVSHEWLSIAVELRRGSTEGRSNIVLDASNFIQDNAENVYAHDGRIQLIDPDQEGTYVSNPINLGTVSRFDEVLVSLFETYEANEILVDTVTGISMEDVVNLSRIESQWKRVINGRIQSGIKAWMMYRFRIVPGKTNRRIAEFRDDTATEWDSHANRTNVDIIVDNVDDYIQLSNPRIPGTYVSEQFNLGFQDNLHPITVKSPNLNNLKLSVSYKVNGVWKELVPVFLDATGVGILPQSNAATGLRYSLELLPIQATKTIDDLYTESRLRTNAVIHPNVQIGSDGSIKLKDAGMNDVYTSPTFDATDVIQYRSFTYDEAAPAGTSLVVEIATSDTDEDWASQTWVKPDKTTGQFTIPKRRYLRFKVTLIGNGTETPVMSNIVLSYDARTYSTPKVYSVDFSIDQFDRISPVMNSVTFTPIKTDYHTPTVSNIVVKPEVFEFVKVVPIFHEIGFGGHVAAGYGVENYTVPMNGEIITDGVVRDVTNRTVEEIVKSYLADQGVDNSDTLSFSDYLLDWDNTLYPVELYTATMGNEIIRGRSTANVGEVLYRNVKIYFDKETSGVVLKPVPQAGSPIVVKNASGKLLRQVHFRDDYGAPTISNTESLETNGTRFLYLEYRGIDPITLQVFIDVDGNGELKKVDDCMISENRLVLPVTFPAGRAVRVVYRLKDSFFVNYNHAPAEDVCLLRVHTPFNPDDKETRRIDVKYEVSKTTAYYLAKEINLNPLKNHINSGFVYLTDQVYAPFKIEVDYNPNVLYKNKEDRVTVNARVVDKFGNPLVGRKVTFSASKGVIRVMDSNFTDHNGMVTAVFSTAGLTDPFVTEAVVTITEDSTKISQDVTIYFVDEKFVNKLAIISEKNAVSQRDVVKLKIITMGANSERLAGKSIDFRIWKAADLDTPLVSTTGQTDINGEFSVFYQISESFLGEEDTYLLVEAETYDQNGKIINEQMLINVSTFKRNLETPIITATLN